MSGAARAGTLPTPLTGFIGRERETAELTRLLDGTRLLTLSGTGGVGKTRLAMEVAARLADRFRDGVKLVELASLADPLMLSPGVAAAVDAREGSDRPLQATLLDALHEKHLRILLDNCEHVVDACAVLVDALLGGCPDLRVPATSREPLGLVGEVIWRVPPLSLPELLGVTCCCQICCQPGKGWDSTAQPGV